MIFSSCSQRSSGNSSIGDTCWRPALFTRMSTPPHSAVARSTRARQSARLLTSACWNTPADTSDAAMAPSLSFTSAKRTFAPCRARSIATARPIPLAAPVTRAPFPRSSATAFTCAVRYGALYAVETHALSKDFAGFRAVNNVNLRLEEGAVHALVGPNGAGTTAPLDLATGFCAPSSGRLLLFVEDAHGLRPGPTAQRGVARSVQLPHRFAH